LSGNKAPTATNLDPLFLLDESLNPKVSEALCLVGYHILSIKTVFSARPGVEDPEVIEWCRVNDAVWITADERARKRHLADICSSRIRVIWIHRTQGKMSSKDQLRVIANALPDLIERFNIHQKQLHYCLKVHGLPNKERLHIEEIDLKESWK
jgi:predicted nuclease of predicted toxin-antitoxin system